MITGSTSLDDSFTQGTLVTKCRMCKQEALLNHDFVCKTCWICNSRSPGVVTMSLNLKANEDFKALERRIEDLEERVTDLVLQNIDFALTIHKFIKNQGTTNDMESVPIQTDN